MATLCAQLVTSTSACRITGGACVDVPFDYPGATTVVGTLPVIVTPTQPPACALTVAEGGACVTGTDQTCSKTCGPDSVGWKSETCSANAWVEGKCQYLPGDYRCFKITASTALCDGTVVASGGACTDPTCTACGSATQNAFTDSTGALKVGYCVCTSLGKWTCASTSTPWPCTSPGVVAYPDAAMIGC